MDVMRELNRTIERMSTDSLPATWLTEPALADVDSFGALVIRIRRLGACSDAALQALARLAANGEREACLVVTVALLPLLIVRCDRRRELIVEAVSELAARMVEPAAEPWAGGVANRLLRRVVWRVLHERGVREWQLPLPDLSVVAASSTAAGHDSFEARTLDRLTLLEFRRRLAEHPDGHEAWAMLVDSTERSGMSSTERSRLAKHRRTVRELATSTLVA